MNETAHEINNKVLGSVAAKSKRLPPSAGKGRKPGVPNKVTQLFRNAISEAFEELGGKDWLLKVAKEDPRAFIGLVARLIPAEANVSLTSKVTLEQLVLGSMEEPDE